MAPGDRIWQRNCGGGSGRGEFWSLLRHLVSFLAARGWQVGGVLSLGWGLCMLPVRRLCCGQLETAGAGVARGRRGSGDSRWARSVLGWLCPSPPPPPLCPHQGWFIFRFRTRTNRRCQPQAGSLGWGMLGGWGRRRSCPSRRQAISLSLPSPLKANSRRLCQRGLLAFSSFAICLELQRKGQPGG